MRKNTCPVCGNQELKVLFTLEHIPVLDNALAETAAQAKNAVLGTQRLVQCYSCGFVFNSEFEEQKVIYSEEYHTERGNSNAYRQHMSNTLDFIDSVESLQGKTVLEVACGTGEFLYQAAQYGPSHCVGVDPSAEAVKSENLSIHQTFFNEEYLRQNPANIDILINCHMIEHMQEPLEILRLFAQALPLGGLLYIETPRLDWILDNHVFYDFPYEHCSYYSDAFMLRMLKAAGFSVVDMKFSYGGQYFSICARKSGRSSALEPVSPKELYRVCAAFSALIDVYTNVNCTETLRLGLPSLEAPLTQLNDCYLWGAAAKGVMCANLLNQWPISGLVDKNPYKQGKFVPGTAHPVLAPESISYPKVKTVLVENDIYYHEIQKEVQKIDARIQTVSLNKLLGIGI